MIEDATINN